MKQTCKSKKKRKLFICCIGSFGEYCKNTCEKFCKSNLKNHTISSYFYEPSTRKWFQELLIKFQKYEGLFYIYILKTAIRYIYNHILRYNSDFVNFGRKPIFNWQMLRLVVMQVTGAGPFTSFSCVHFHTKNDNEKPIRIRSKLFKKINKNISY